MNANQAEFISISNTHETLQVDERLITDLILAVSAREQVPVSDLSIVLCDHETVLTLNKSYLAHDFLTDVLSFPLNDSDSEEVDGEIYVDLDTASERCGEFGVSFEHEACRYVVHGLLHLIGYTDDTPELKRKMQILENRYLAGVFES